MNESQLKQRQEATHYCEKTGQIYKQGRFGFIYWWSELGGWERCHPVNGLRDKMPVTYDFKYKQN